MCRAQVAAAAVTLSSCSGGTVHNSRGTKMCLGTTRAGDTAGCIFIFKEKAVEHSESLKTLANGTSKTNTTR